MASKVRYVVHVDLPIMTRSLYQRGGPYQRASLSVDAILGRMAGGDEDPFRGFHVTNYGESRIKHCVKYDLANNHCRLITIQDNGICALFFVGDHAESENWLNRNKGQTLAVGSNRELIDVRTSRNLRVADLRISAETNWDVGKLVSKIPADYYDRIADGIPRTVLMQFESLESTSSEDDILEFALEIDQIEKQNLYFDVFNKLRSGDIDGAKLSIDLYSRNLCKVEELSSTEIQQVVEGDTFADPEVVTTLLKHFMETADYRDWMLFMGRDQKELVNADYPGPVKLAGVSGSGKTSVVVKRAIRLSEKYPDGRILVLTLNPALAKLIEHLVDYACLPESRGRIDVRSFWQLCQAELRKLEPNDFDKLYSDVTWKNNEHISEIWNEYYDPWNQRAFNNHDAALMLPIHRELLTRSVFPKTYVSQEFDWIRSALSPDNRSDYLEITRRGRHVPFDKVARELLIRGLEGWENKMAFVGVIDYLGLAIALHRHLNDLQQTYRCVLVDEAQDFGTLELQIIRQLVPEAQNDIFLCGDIMQRISSKHHNLKAAGIDVIGRSKILRKNYRNSREILRAAYEILYKSMNMEDMEEEDFEILDPEYANFSTPKPLLLNALSLKEELTYSINYISEKFRDANNGRKACIAVSGMDFLAVKRLGASLQMAVLDGNVDLQSTSLVLSDLSQMKGYEFDSVCILNCSSSVLPDPNQPKDESYRDLSRLYVAMTRAKSELILSFSDKPSVFLSGCEDLFTKANWTEYSTLEETILNGYAVAPPTSKGQPLNLKITGEDYLYTKQAVGLDPRIQEQLLKTVTGIQATANQRQTEWRTIEDLLEDEKRNWPAVASAFGEKSFQEFKTWIAEKG